MFIMHDSSIISGLPVRKSMNQITGISPANKKRGLSGRFRYAQIPPNPSFWSFWIGGIFYALDFSRRFAACHEQRI